MSKSDLNRNQITKIPTQIIKNTVKTALDEDIENGDITATLIDESVIITAFCITREDMVLCGQDFANEVLNQIDKRIHITWFFNDSDFIEANQKIFELKGSARSILTAERCLLNFIQTLSATATQTHKIAELISDYDTKLLDTRKTIPGLRIAQKYAVRCGGGYNHRIGLFDGYLIKENHIHSAGSITKAVERAYELNKDKIIEVEVTNISELQEAIKTKTHIIMLDNFPIESIKKAVSIAKDNNVLLEVSGNINENSIVEIAKTGVDFISVGAITKNIKAIDLSMLTTLRL